jgi:probable F420-dependent oxidoreductase
VHRRPFRFGLQSYHADSAAHWRDQARHAEALGFSAFHLADHVIGPGPKLAATNHPVQTLAAIPAMAVAAEVTTSIRIGCRVLCVDYRNPVMLAKELATLDMFSEGRLEIGLGAGWLANEYDAIGIPFDASGVRLARLQEQITVLRACFGDGEVSVIGEHVHAEGFEAVPKPVQRPCPPLMIGGGAPRILAIAGREADIVSLNFDNSSGKLGPAGMASSTADLTEQKIQWVRDAAGARFADLDIEIGAYFTVVTDDGATVAERMAPMFGLSPAQFADHPNVLIGSVAEICDRIVERRERFGINYVTFGASAVEAVAPIVERLAST